MKSIRELLSGRPPQTLPGSSSALDAARTMEEKKIGAILIVDGEKRPLGVFTERDLMVRVVVPGHDPEKKAIQDVMTRELFTCEPDRRINEVAREMQERHIRHLPVVEKGVAIGMLSLRDLLREHLDQKRHEVEALTAYIQGEGENPAP